MSTIPNDDDLVDQLLNRLRKSPAFGMSVLFRVLIQILVNKPELARFNTVKGERATVLEFLVHTDDMRFLLGRGGGTIKALRLLAHVIGRKQGISFSLIELPGHTQK